MQLNFSNTSIERIVVHSIDNGKSTLASDFIDVNTIDQDLVLHTILTGFRAEMVKQPVQFSFFDVQMQNINNFDIHNTHIIADVIAQKFHSNKGLVLVCVLGGVMFTNYDEIIEGPALLVGFISDYSFSVNFNDSTIDTIKYITELNTAILCLGDVCFAKNQSTSHMKKQVWADFINVADYDCPYTNTNKLVNVIKSFVKEVYNAENDVTPLEQQIFLNHAKTTLTDVDGSLQMYELAEAVLDDEDAKKEFIDHMQLANISSEIIIDADALKSKQKLFKRILKLDKNFHVYIHGVDVNDMIEQGFDTERKQSFYKLYYNSES